jgi:hypothetical protein
VLFAATEMLRQDVTCYIEPGDYHPDAMLGGGMRAVLAVSYLDKNKAVTG